MAGADGHGERGHRHQRAGQLGRERAVQSYPGAGGWGRLSVATPLLTMDGGLLTAFTVGPGRGGDIMVGGGRLILTGGAQIDSSTSNAGTGDGDNHRYRLGLCLWWQFALQSC